MAEDEDEIAGAKIRAGLARQQREKEESIRAHAEREAAAAREKLSTVEQLRRPEGSLPEF